MITDRNPPRILVLSKSQSAMDILKEALPKDLCVNMEYASGAGDARRRLAVGEYALIIINTPLKDDYGVQPAIEMSEQYPIGVILIVSGDRMENVRCRAEEYGIVVISKQIDRKSLYMAAKTLITIQKKLLRMTRETSSLKVKVDEMKIIDRARWVLIDKEKMAESEAHQYIEKEAMNRCVRRVEIAGEIIRSQGIEKSS